MIRGLILDGEHEGHLVNLAEPMPTVRMAVYKQFRAVCEPSISPDVTAMKSVEYKAAFRPLDDGNLWLYAEKKSDNVFFSQRRDWVVKDKRERSKSRKEIVIENNDPHHRNRLKHIEELKSQIKKNVVARDDFDLDGHLLALCYAVR